jgi:GxxExxY protein
MTEGAETPYRENTITERIIAAAIEVHRHIGPGLLESAYEECLCRELQLMGIPFQRQLALPVNYKGVRLDCAYKLDLLVDDKVIVEIKAVEDFAPVHHSQLLTYLKLTNKRVGLLINFHVPILKNGLKRVVNRYAGPALAPRTPHSEEPSAKTPHPRDSAFSEGLPEEVAR